VEDLSAPDIVYQIGVEPVRIDIITSIAGLKFRGAYNRGADAKFGRASVKVLSLADTITAKRAADRPQDRLDVQRLLVAQRYRDRAGG
jgi:hypothetical protein